jgi:hypothetical protein
MLLWWLEVYHIGSKQSALTYINTWDDDTVFAEDVDKRLIGDLYDDCWVDGDFEPSRLVNAALRSRDPPGWKDEEGFLSMHQYMEYLSKGPIMVLATKTITAGREIIADYELLGLTTQQKALTKEILRSDSEDDEDVKQDSHEAEHPSDEEDAEDDVETVSRNKGNADFIMDPETFVKKAEGTVCMKYPSCSFSGYFFPNLLHSIFLLTCNKCIFSFSTPFMKECHL